jgi:SLOG cluster3 family
MGYTVVIPNSELIWGGHPSITPLIRFVVKTMNYNLKNHVTLYQSLYFEDKFPKDNFDFENIVLTPKLTTRETSLELMRNEMLSKNNFKAGIFIGGMEGVLDEFKMLVEFHPKVIILPIASTGAAAKIIYQDYLREKNQRLENDYAYMALFKDLLSEII